MLGGVGLAALIGIPGLLLYLAARALGLNAEVEPSALHHSWWRIPVLILSAFANGFAEEVVVVGYLITRLEQLGLSSAKSVLAQRAARDVPPLPGVRRGAGQRGDGPGVRVRVAPQRRLWPLVIAHGLIDTVAFVGYVLLAGHRLAEVN